MLLSRTKRQCVRIRNEFFFAKIWVQNLACTRQNINESFLRVGCSERAVAWECAKAGNNYARKEQASNIHVLDRSEMFLVASEDLSLPN